MKAQWEYIYIKKKTLKLSTVATFIVEQSLTVKSFIIVTDVQKQPCLTPYSLGRLSSQNICNDFSVLENVLMKMYSKENNLAFLKKN